MGKTTEKHVLEGFVLPLVLIFMAVFSVFSITFTQVLINTNRQIREQVNFTKAYYIARSGADIGRQLVASGETSWATFTGSLDSGDFSVRLEEDNLIVSDATFNGVAAQAWIGFSFSEESPHVALYASESLLLDENAFIDGDVGILSGGSISLGESVEEVSITGDLKYEIPPLNPDFDTSVVQGKLNNTSVSSPTVPPFPEIPANLPIQTSLSVANNALETINGDGDYPSIEVKSGGRLNINSGVPGDSIDVLVDSLNIKGEVYVSGEGTVTITVLNSCEFSGGIFSAPDPNRFRIHFVNPSEDFSLAANGLFPGTLFLEQETVKLTGTGSFGGPVICKESVSNVTVNGGFSGLNLYSPNSTITISGNAKLEGWVFGRDVTVSGTAEISYSESSYQNPNGGGGEDQLPLFVWLR